MPRPVRMFDLLSEDALRARIDEQLAVKNVLFRELYGHQGMKAE